MNEKRIAIILLAASVLAGCKATTPGPTARLYLDMFEIERYAPHADPQASLMTTRFRLLERPEVQADLGLSQDQMHAIRTAYKTPWKEIPGLSDFIAEQKEKKAGLSEDDRKAANLESSRGISRRTAEFHGQKLNDILTPQQHERLDQLLIQAHGPVLILVQTNLASALAITPEQMKELTAQVHEADREIIPDLQKFGRGFISGYGPGEDEKTREREMKELITRLRRLITVRDNRILELLSDDQRREWPALQGKSLQIDWSPWDLMKTPFEKEDS
ncbi:hypothetical protein M0R36_08965 [bacterium]|jgi:hypothetical protein|nr:hypothetical protein [bacterium]